MLPMAIPDVEISMVHWLAIWFYLIASTNVSGSRGWEFEGQGQCRGLKVANLFLGITLQIIAVNANTAIITI